jgi:flagellar hook-length control protein FliK
MVDAISVIAPQSVGIENPAGQVSDNAAQDGSQFAAVLDTTIKDGQQTQAQDAQVQDDKSAAMQVVEADVESGHQTGSTDALAAGEAMAAQMMAMVNAQTATPVAPQVVEATMGNVDLDAVSDPKTDIAVDTNSSKAVLPQMSGQVPVITPESAVAQTETSQIQTSELQTATMAVEDEASVVSDADTLASTQDATVPTKAEANIKQSVVTEDGADQPRMAEATQQQAVQTDKGAKLRSSTKSEVKVQDARAVNAQATEVVKAPDVREAQRTVSEHKARHEASASGSQTRIEVSASAEPPREFTIKPQVMNPVTSHVRAAEALISGAVSEVASTENGGVKSETSGSQTNGQTSAFAGQVSFDTAVKQVTETQGAPRTEQPVHQRVIDQIVQEVRMIKLPQRTDLIVRLTPPELGTLRVQISQAENGMTAQIQTSGEQVKGLLQANLPALNQALTDVGLKMDSVSVTAGSSFGSLMQDTTHGSAQQQYGSRRHGNSGYQTAVGVQTMVNLSSTMTGVGDNQGYSWLA